MTAIFGEHGPESVHWFKKRIVSVIFMSAVVRVALESYSYKWNCREVPVEGVAAAGRKVVAHRATAAGIFLTSR
jgi:hypothetical protein